jgi:hypothetical protein
MENGKRPCAYGNIKGNKSAVYDNHLPANVSRIFVSQEFGYA